MVKKNSNSNKAVLDLFEKSKTLLEKGNNVDSEKLLKKALKLDPNNLAIFHMLSTVLTSQRKFLEYLKLWKNNITIKDKGHRYFHLAEGHYLLDEIEEALLHINKAIQREKYSSSNHNLKSRILLEQKKYDESLVEIDKAIEISPGNGDHFLQKGEIFQMQEKYRIALEYFNKARKLDDSPHSIFSLIPSLEKLNKQDEALKELEILLKKNPNDELLLNAKAGVQRSLGKRKETIDTVKKAVKINPNSFFIKRNLARAYMDNKDYKKAIKILLDLKKEEYDTSVISLLSDVYLATNNKTKAMSILKEAHKKVPDDSIILNGIILAYFSLKDFQQAETFTKKYLKLYPNDSLMHSMMGLIYRYLEDYKKSIESFNKSLMLEPNNVDVMYDIACLKSIEGKYDEALAILRLVIIRESKYKDMAKKDDDFSSLKNNQEFKKITK